MPRVRTSLLALLLAVPAAAAEPDAAARARVIAPYLDEETLAVAHVDATRLRVDALTDWLAKTTKIDAKELDDPRQMAQQMIAAFTRAGGRDAYVVISLADVPDQPLVVVPLREGADAKALKTLLATTGLEKAEVRGSVLLAGGRRALERLQALKPAARPEVEEAFAAAGDTTAQVLVLPTANLRRAFEEVMPRLPSDAGGTPITPLTRGLRWAAFGFDLPPGASLRVTMQCRDPASAVALRDLLMRTCKAVGQQKEVRDYIPDYDRLAALLAPRVAEDRLTLVVNEEQALPLVQPLLSRFRAFDLR
jgi:hypothetical protein